MHNLRACPIKYDMKLFDCLPYEISAQLIGIGDVRELRIRNGGAVRVNVEGRWYYLGANKSLVMTARNAFTVGKVCDDIVKKACSNSVYAYEKSLAGGYFTLEDGVRVGVCGQMSGSDKRVFQQYTSLCFRIPHYINCVTENILKKCELNNTIVIGAPASGKTTFLRDVAVKLGQMYNVLVADERGELFYDDNLIASSCCDVLKWADKPYAFEVGARAMSPQYFVCDELFEADIGFVKSCAASGIKLVCSAHASSEGDFDRRFGLLNYFGFVVDLNKNQLNCSRIG